MSGQDLEGKEGLKMHRVKRVFREWGLSGWSGREQGYRAPCYTTPRGTIHTVLYDYTLLKIQSADVVCNVNGALRVV